MATLDADMAAHVQDAAEGIGIRVVLGAELQEIVRATPCASTARSCPPTTSSSATGARPATGLARDAGLEVGDSGALRVDDHQRCPGHDGVFAAGDCAECQHRVLDRPVNIQLGTHANKQGRIAGANATGGDVGFPGVIGTAVSKICRYEVARTGISEREARGRRDRGRQRDDQGPHARRLLPGRRADLGQARRRARTGACSAGRSSASRARRSASTCSRRRSGPGIAVDELALLDLSYAPPFSGVYDPLLIAARAAAKAL